MICSNCRTPVQASDAITSGAAVIVLSDRATSAERAPVPALLAVGAVHHNLVVSRLRTRAALMVEAGDAREVRARACVCVRAHIYAL